ncbi:MAG: TlpA disulfide reductase family protein [Planctomycetota bacterium]
MARHFCRFTAAFALSALASCAGPSQRASPSTEPETVTDRPPIDGFALTRAAAGPEDGPLLVMASGMPLVEPASLGLTALPAEGELPWRGFRCAWSAEPEASIHGIFTPGRLALDQDGDGDLADEVVHPLAVGASVDLTIPADLAGEAIPLRFLHPRSGRLELNVPLVYRGTIQHGGESLQVAAGRLLPDLALLMADTDGDGVVETPLTNEQVVGLGGASWTVEVELAAARAYLRPSNREPVAPGHRAPELAGTTDHGDPFDLAKQPHDTALVFCACSCAGCRQLAPRLRELYQELGGEEIRIVQVVRSEPDRQEFDTVGGIGWPQLVDASAWDRYQVVATPTVVLVDDEGTVQFRGSGHDPRWMTRIRNGQ